MITEISKLEGLSPQPKPQPTQPGQPTSDVAPSGTASSTGAPLPKGDPQAAQPVDRAQVENVAQDLQKLAQNLHRELNFRVDDDTGEVVIRVIDAENGETLRQIPSEAILKLQQKLAELQVTGGGADASGMDGVLFNDMT